MITNVHACLEELSGEQALDALLGFVTNHNTASIADYVIAKVTGLDRANQPRDVLVRAVTVGRQTLFFAFGSSDVPVIDYSLQVIGEPLID